MHKRVPLISWKIGVAVLLLGLVLIALAGCGRQTSASTHASSRNKRGGVHAAETSSSDVAVPSEVTDTPTETATAPAATEHTSPASQNGPLLYGDARLPNYDASDPKWEKQRFEWEGQDGISTLWVELQLDANMYSYYRGLGRYYTVEEYYHYIDDENNRATVRGIVDVLRKIADEHNYDAGAVAREIAKFVQSCVTYRTDMESTGQEEYPKYPIETLYERQGDCEDTSILMAAMLREFGYEVGFLHLPNHVAVALRTVDDYEGGAYYQIGDKRYLYIESTNDGWNIGDIPDDYAGIQAEFYPIP